MKDLPSAHDSLRLVAGIEFSTHWENTGIHILGLNINTECDAIKTGTRFQTDARLQRARVIGEKLEKQGIENEFEGANRLSIGSYIGRQHFARHLINIGQVKDMQSAFKKYLGAGKTGDVKHHWADLPQVVE